VIEDEAGGTGTTNPPPPPPPVIVIPSLDSIRVNVRSSINLLAFMNMRIIRTFALLRIELRRLQRSRGCRRLLQWWMPNSGTAATTTTTTTVNGESYCKEIMNIEHKVVLKGTILLVNMSDSLLVYVERIREVQREISALRASQPAP